MTHSELHKLSMQRSLTYAQLVSIQGIMFDACDKDDEPALVLINRCLQLPVVEVV